MSFVADHDMRVWHVECAPPLLPLLHAMRNSRRATVATTIPIITDVTMYPTPTKRKKMTSSLARDSLATRYKIGIPGSKRWQRYHNERFIIALARSLSDDDEFLMDDDDFYHNNVPPSPLKQLFSDEVKMKSFLPFVHVTEEEERELLMALEQMRINNAKQSKKRSHLQADFDNESEMEEDSADEYFVTPEEAFDRIRNPLRRMLKQFYHTEAVQSIDKRLIEFMQQDTYRIEIAMPDPYHRKLAHGISKYYCLESYSKDTPQGRVVVFQKTKYSLKPPISLCGYLSSLEEKQ